MALVFFDSFLLRYRNKKDVSERLHELNNESDADVVYRANGEIYYSKNYYYLNVDMHVEEESYKIYAKRRENEKYNKKIEEEERLEKNKIRDAERQRQAIINKPIKEAEAKKEKEDAERKKKQIAFEKQLKNFPHWLHFIISCFTHGIWILVWIFLYNTRNNNGRKYK